MTPHHLPSAAAGALSRRRWMAAIGVLAATAGGHAGAQGSGTSRIIVPFTPGASNDTIGRLVADALGRRGGRSWIVENKPGAGSQLGTDFVAKAAPDGHTLLLAASAGMGILPAMKAGVPYSVERDFSYLARIASSPFALAVNSQVPAASFADFLKLARDKPGSIRLGSSGIGALDYMGATMLQARTKTELNVIPYKGMSQVLNDLRAGHIDAAIISPATLAPLVAEKKLRALAVFDAQRNPRLPEVPSAPEVGLAGLEVVNWWGIAGPAGLQPAVTKGLTEQLTAVLADPAFRKSMEEKGFDLAPLSGADFARFVQDDLQRWRTIARESRIKLTD